MTTHLRRAIVTAASVAAALGFTTFCAEKAQAEPPPGCLYQSPNWYDPCSDVGPQQRTNGNNWLPVDGVPGMYGPHGYTPRCDSIYC
jgi:hypothetical protein